MTRPVPLREVRMDPVKFVLSAAATGGMDPRNREWAVKRWGEAFAPVQIDKADLAAAGAKALGPVPSGGVIDKEMFTAIAEASALFRMRGVRKVGFRQAGIFLGGSGAGFLDEGAGLPVLDISIDNIGLDEGAVGGIVIVTRAALHFQPNLESAVHSDLAAAIAKAIDLAAFDVANTGAGPAPPSLVHASPVLPGSGDLSVDLPAMLDAFGGNVGSAYFVGNPEVLASLALQTLGRDVGAKGGDLLGIPALPSQGAPDGQLTLIDAGQIMLARGDDVELSTTNDGVVHISAAPVMSSVVPTPHPSTELTSLFAHNLHAIRGLALTSWALAKSDAAVTLTLGVPLP